MGLFSNSRKSGSSRAGRSNAAERILSDKSPWPIQEAYKALRTNITFSLPGNESKVIAVSSAFQHDGKSINCVNTAISFGQLQKKVLLIECDLRLPTVGERLGIQSAPGLSDCLVGEAKVTDCLHRDTKYGIDVLTSGNIPPDPTWLLQSSQMSALLTALRNIYDYIFIDLPPVTTVTDASIMAKYADGFLFVVRHQVTETPAIEDAMTQLDMAGAKVLGFIYNDVVEEQGRYSRHSSNYKRYYKK